MAEITQERVDSFLQGRDEMKRVITIECDYQDDMVNIIYVNEKGEKRIKKDEFRPFVWVKMSAAQRLFGGDRKLILNKLREYGIGIRTLVVGNDKPIEKSNQRIENGYRFIFYAKNKMSFGKFQNFFIDGGVPINERQKKGSAIKIEQNKEILSVTPVEQYMIASGKRLFKGYENYNDLHRVTFDLETQGLNPKIHRIEQIGIHNNRGYDKILSVTGNTEEEKDKNEASSIEMLIAIFAKLKPDIICGHNSENFDWDFIMQRYEILVGDFQGMTLKYFAHQIYKKKHDAVLKLGGEVEYYKPTVMWGHVILDSLHAARRAQAIDSSMKSSNLKYVTKYLNLNKPNRVYVPGDKITSTWAITSPTIAFNDENGDWYHITENKPLQAKYKAVSGRYIVERYLLDDIWETDKVEEKLNESNFLVAKILPTTFTRACTMGTAGIWKLIILAWCYENNLIVPATVPSHTFTGGLSRLLKTGYVDRVVKLDYNSLYPSIILTWNITSEVDESNVLASFLNYVLTQREKYKGLKADAGKNADELKKKLESDDSISYDEKKKIKQEIQYWKGEKSGNDKKQLPLKILGNSIFGSFGACHLFPLGSINAAERTTCVGRQCLRLMISHFKKLRYTPIVGDSFTYDTPVFVKYKDGYIDIVPIYVLFDEKTAQIDGLKREYDVSKKDYKVLCRSGWVTPNYIYRHKTNKDIYSIKDNCTNLNINVTQDHSLFNNERQKISPKTITNDTKLEYTNQDIFHFTNCNDKNNIDILYHAYNINALSYEKIPCGLLNMGLENTISFVQKIDKDKVHNCSKTVQAAYYYLVNKINALKNE